MRCFAGKRERTSSRPDKCKVAEGESLRKRSRYTRNKLCTIEGAGKLSEGRLRELWCAVAGDGVAALERVERSALLGRECACVEHPEDPRWEKELDSACEGDVARHFEVEGLVVSA